MTFSAATTAQAPDALQRVSDIAYAAYTEAHERFVEASKRAAAASDAALEADGRSGGEHLRELADLADTHLEECRYALIAAEESIRTLYPHLTAQK